MTEFSLTRRRFAIGAAAATAAMALPAGVVSATPAEEQAATAPDSKAAAAPATLDEQAQKAFAKLSASGKAEVEMKFQNVMRKYGDKLSAEQKADVRKALAEGQEGLEAMRAFVLANGDQPAAVFHIYRGEGKK